MIVMATLFVLFVTIALIIINYRRESKILDKEYSNLKKNWFRKSSVLEEISPSDNLNKKSIKLVVVAAVGSALVTMILLFYIDSFIIVGNPFWKVNALLYLVNIEFLFVCLILWLISKKREETDWKLFNWFAMCYYSSSVFLLVNTIGKVLILYYG